MKKLLIFCLFLLFSFGILFQVFGAQKVEINFFGQEGCPHCADEDKFLDFLNEKYKGQLEINRFSILNDTGVNRLKNICSQYQIEKCFGATPVTFVNEKFILGFDNPRGIGVQIENAIKEELGLGNIDNDKKVYLPLIGEIDFREYSFPVLAMLLGFFDGFNVCSLGALVLILSLIMALKSRKKILLFGSTFIVTTAAVYGMLIFIWYKIFSVFQNYLGILRILIGLVSLFGAIYFFKQFLKFKKEGPACAMQNQGLSAKLSKRVSNSFGGSAGILALIGAILVFAFAITIVEFPCSAAIPLVFAGTLTHAGVSSGMYVLYILIYIFFYLLDELIVFLIAAVTMKLWMASSKFVIWSAFATSMFLLAMSSYYIYIVIKALFTPVL